MSRRMLSLILAVFMMTTLASCKAGEASSSSQSRASASSLQLAPVQEPPQEPAARNPLTGLGIDPEKADQRPVAVMLNNLKASLPQLGVSKADIIYEVLAEGGITRMLAVFQDLDGVGDLGSIRSTRAYYLEIALGHDAILVHAGGSPEAYSCIPKWGVDNLDGVNGGSEQEIYWRDPERRKNAGYEHSLLTSGEKIQEYLAGGRYATKHEDGYRYEMTFAEDGTPAGGSAAEHVSVKFSKSKTGTFDYDAGEGAYLVGQYNGAYVDGGTGDQVAVTNVLVLRTRISLISGDSAGRISVDLSSGGEGMYCCGGKSVPIRWSKSGRTEPFAYTLEDGTPLTLGRGTTYVCIVGLDSAVTAE
ncbi:DUF3048 domain-containing protein [Oscillibacter sp. MSJ-2]|uniref:DUF3048 domain-containing protein n=1 Tax=Dysosmobacter acutus TaxID=2841504 RepID=A0ABS6FA48_9FIRM|nr:DUF3048 domain-containing protein [Dysosmobacter acutus]MBU5627168.1 DUF3048 domain-containing protein [Dysosmobacter acutus]